MYPKQHHSTLSGREAYRLSAALALALLLLAGAAWGAARPAAAQDATPTPGQTIPPPVGTPYFLPLVAVNPPSTPESILPPRAFDSVPVAGGSLGWPAQVSPDTNLAWRGYAPTAAYLGLVNYDGDTDDDAPQLAAVFSPPRLPIFRAAHQVYDWDWNCNPSPGCRGALLTYPYPVTLLEMAASAGEPLAIAGRRAPMYAPDYKAMVLYAEESRLTLTYTREDTPANGYLLHFEDVAVDPALVALYRRLDAEGRHSLPALRNGEIWGTATGVSVKVAVRDRGMFMDPRSCKDWWGDYRGQCVVQLQRPLGWQPQR